MMADDAIDAGMDLEGRLRFHADACRLLDEASSSLGSHPLAAALRDEVDAATAGMRAAVAGRDADGIHAADWDDKPHRLVYDAADLMERSADLVARF